MKLSDSTSFVFDLLGSSASYFQNASLVAKKLDEDGIKEQRLSDLGEQGYISRDASAVAAYRIPKQLHGTPRFAVYAAHLDSPCLKVKPEPVTFSKNLAMLATEPYGGLIYSSFLDVPLYLSGRVYTLGHGRVIGHLLDLTSPIAFIPRLAIHFDRGVNESSSLNAAKDLNAVISLQNGPQRFDFYRYILNMFPGEDMLISHDLFLLPKGAPTVLGAHGEFFLSPRIDDLSCAYSGLYGFLHSEQPDDTIAVYCAFSSEEVGSSTYVGAGGALLRDLLSKIAAKCGFDLEEALERSLLVSADCAHAGHPNHPEIEDPSSQVRMGRGIVFKHSARMAYTTNASTEAMGKFICLKNHIQYQDFSNRSDLRGGSTLGAISNGVVSMPSLDIGIAQLAMHSGFEEAAVSDLDDLCKFAGAFFSTSFGEADR